MYSPKSLHISPLLKQRQGRLKRTSSNKNKKRQKLIMSLNPKIKSRLKVNKLAKKVLPSEGHSVKVYLQFPI